MDRIEGIPTANLVNAVMEKLFEWQREGKVPLDTLLDAGLLDDNYPFLLVDAVEELNKRHEHMPISDVIKEEAKRGGRGWREIKDVATPDSSHLKLIHDLDNRASEEKPMREEITGLDCYKKNGLWYVRQLDSAHPPFRNWRCVTDPSTIARLDQLPWDRTP